MHVRLVVALAVLAVIAGCGSHPVSLEQMGWGVDDIAVIEVRCGTTGQYWLVDEEELVKPIARLVTEMELRTGDQSPYSGYAYTLDLHSEDQRTLRLVIAGTRVVAGDRQYWIEQGIGEELANLIADL